MDGKDAHDGDYKTELHALIVSMSGPIKVPNNSPASHPAGVQVNQGWVFRAQEAPTHLPLRTGHGSF